MKKTDTPYDRVASLYDRVFDSVSMRQREYDWFETHGRPSSEDVLLDLGCGNGALLREAAPRVKKAIGIDASAGMLACAGKNLTGAKNVRLLLAAGPRLPLPDSSVDLVVSFFSFRYLAGERALKEIFRVLKPLGRIVIIDMMRHPRGAFFPLALAVDKMKLLAHFAARPRRYLALRRLVAHPDWKRLLAASPLQSFESFRELLTHHFSAARLVCLNRGVRARTVAFHSGPMGVFRKTNRKNPAPALAVMDWGVGGLGFYRAFKKAYPRAPVLYLSDSGYTPYGKTSPRRLAARLNAILRFLEAAGVRRLVVACNAMSTILEGFPAPSLVSVTGVIRPAVAYVRNSGFKTIGVIGGRRTIASGAYRRGLEGEGRRVVQRQAQALSAFVERGDIKSPAFREALDGILSPLGEVEALVLACTHYRAAEKPIHARVRAALIDPADATLEWVKANWRPPVTAGRDVFFTTGDRAATVAAARSMFGVDIREIHPLEI